MEKMSRIEMEAYIKNSGWGIVRHNGTARPAGSYSLFREGYDDEIFIGTPDVPGPYIDTWVVEHAFWDLKKWERDKANEP